jgi:hypothetical protein
MNSRMQIDLELFFSALAASPDTEYVDYLGQRLVRDLDLQTRVISSLPVALCRQEQPHALGSGVQPGSGRLPLTDQRELFPGGVYHRRFRRSPWAPGSEVSSDKSIIHQ